MSFCLLDLFQSVRFAWGQCACAELTSWHKAVNAYKGKAESLKQAGVRFLANVRILVNIIYIVEFKIMADEEPNAAASFVQDLSPLASWPLATYGSGNHFNRIGSDGAFSELQRRQSLDIFQRGIGAFFQQQFHGLWCAVHRSHH